MEITSHPVEGAIDVNLRGRLDGYWADHLAQALEETIRGGHHHIRLNMSEVLYLSSLGIRVLVAFYKKVDAIEGTFVVSDASQAVKKVLDMVGLGATLMPKTAAPATARSSEAPAARTLERENATFEIFNLSPDGLSGTMFGDPSLLDGCRFGESDCHKALLPENTFGFGLGAFGHSFGECQNRFGEFLAVAGAAAYQPTDGSNVPDFQLAQGSFVPEMEVLYGAVCNGSMAALARFDIKPDRAALGLTELASTALEIAGADHAGMVCVAESAGLVGASLRRSPVNEEAGVAFFTHPQIRNWLSFTTERAYPRALAIVVGVISRSSSGPFAELLRPLGAQSGILGHFHAAAFSYRPLQRGLIDLKNTVRSVFEHETLQAVLHLIGDDRDAVGVAESEFVRGACWLGPITSSRSERRAA